MSVRFSRSAAFALAAVIGLGAGALPQAVTAADQMAAQAVMNHRTSAFKGVKVNGGTVSETTRDGHFVLTLSDDFKIPDTPAPHWQIVDSQGNTYLLQRLQIKDNKVNTTITVPSYVHDIAKVQIWCAYAEVLLGEASFEKPVQMAAAR